MLSIKHTKKILKDPHMSDEEAEKIRDGFRDLADILFERWMEGRKKLKKANNSE